MLSFQIISNIFQVSSSHSTQLFSEITLNSGLISLIQRAPIVTHTCTDRNTFRLSIFYLNSTNQLNELFYLRLWQACPFQIDVHCEGAAPSILPLSMDTGPKLLNQALQKSIISRTGAKALRGQDNVFVYTYRGEHRITSLIANKVDNRVCVGVVFSRYSLFLKLR